jgi:integrase
MSDTRLYAAGEKPCDHCGDLFSEPVETWKGHNHLYCQKQACNEAARARHSGLYVGADRIRCKTANCSKYIPEGSYGKRTKHFVCSIKCWHSLRYELFGVNVPFVCKWCGADGMGQIPPGKTAPLFCSIDHAGRFRREECLKTSGKFRPILDLYLETFVRDNYRGKSIPTHSHAVVRFLNESGIESLDDVSPLTISAYGKWGRENGSPNLLTTSSHIKRFFDWQMGNNKRQAANPVVNSIHRKRSPKRFPRPYDDQTLELIWSLLERRGNSRLRAEAAIAEESGMRRDEITNIRLSDVDLTRHEIFVRIPNKTNRERIARFGEKARRLISEWLQDRNPDCGHDHLFHNTEGNPCLGLQMHLEFVHVLCMKLRGKHLHDEGIDSWSIHRMRHTMATRLAKGGANYSTIMGAGGWTTFNAMVGYAGVDPEDSRRGYEEAMLKSEENSKLPPQTVSLTLEQYMERAGKTA